MSQPSLIGDQRRTLEETAHRPWTLPRGPWVSAQTWQDLLFAHWRVPLHELRRVVPAQLPVDTFDGTGWIAVVPFLLRGLRVRMLPPLSAFPELNVRTYVTVDGRPGVYFLSLDAASALAVFGARRAYRLPYFHATMSARRQGGEVVYSSERRSANGEPAAFRARYRPRGPSFTAEGSSLEYFLTERYCLYTLDGRRRIHRADIHHPPWVLQPAEAALEHNTMTRPDRIALPGEPLLHFAARQDGIVWPSRRVSEPG